jgi:hypothetical protein
MEDIQGASPTFFLAMSHTWSEWYLQYLQELELVTVRSIREKFKLYADADQYVPNKDEVVALLRKSAAMNNLFRYVNDEDQWITGILRLKRNYDWGKFIKVVSELLGVKELLTAEWYERLGGE